MDVLPLHEDASGRLPGGSAGRLAEDGAEGAAAPPRSATRPESKGLLIC